MATPEDIYQTLIDAGFDPETLSEEDLRLVLSGENIMDQPPEGIMADEGILLDDVRYAADPESMKHSAELPMVTRRIMAGGLDPIAQVVTPGGLKPVEFIGITEEESIDVMAKGAEDYARDINRQAEKKKAMDAWGKRVSAARMEIHDPEEKFVPPVPKLKGAFLRSVVEYFDYSTDPPMEPGWEGAIYQDLAGLTMKGTDAYEKGRAAQVGRTGSGYYGISPGTSMSTGVMLAGPYSPFSYDDVKRRSGGFFVGLGMAGVGIAASVGRYSDQVADHLTESLLISAEADRVSRAGGTSFDWTFTSVDAGMGDKPFSTTINLNVDDVRLSDEEEAESAKELQSLQGKFGEYTAMHEALIKDRLGSNGASMVANLTDDFTHLIGSLVHLFARATGMIELPSQQATTNDLDYMIASARANFSLTNELGPAVIASLAHTVQNPIDNFVARPFTFVIDAMPVWMWGKAAMARGIPVMTDSMLQWADLGLGAGIGIVDMLQMAEARVLPRLSQAKSTGLQAHLRPDILGAPPGQLKTQAIGEWLRRTRADTQAWMTDITAAREASGSELLHFILTEADRRSQIASTAIDLAARRAARGEIDTPGVTVGPKPRRKADRGQAPSQEYIETYPQSWEESQVVWDRAFEGRPEPANTNTIPRQAPKFGVVRDGGGTPVANEARAWMRENPNAGETPGVSWHLKFLDDPRATKAKRAVARKRGPDPEELSLLDSLDIATDVETGTAIHPFTGKIVHASDLMDDIEGAAPKGTPHSLIGPRGLEAMREDMPRGWGKAEYDNLHAIIGEDPVAALKAAQEPYRRSGVAIPRSLLASTMDDAPVVPVRPDIHAGGAGAGMEPTPGFVYHATNSESLAGIIDDGQLNTHSPGWGTDQVAWPDGSIEMRTYWSDSPSTSASFAPEAGTPVMLRARREFQRPGQTGRGGQMSLFDTRKDPTASRGQPAAEFRRERHTNDYYTTESVPASNVEYLGVDNKWHPLQPAEIAIREHGKAGAQAALEKIHRATADPQSGALLKDWSTNDASAMLAMQAELTMQGVDTVDAFWMALERSIDQKINPKGQYPDPPGTDIALKGSTQPVPADVPNSIPVYTERATVDMSTGTVSYRPVATEAEVTAIRTKLEGLAEAGTVDAAFVREVMAMTKGEGKFAGIENRHLGPVPHSFSSGPQNVAIPARARIDPEAWAEITRFAESLGDNVVESAQALKDMTWQITTSTLRYLPDMFRSPKLRSGVSSAMIKRAVAKMSPEAKAALPKGFAKQATKSLDKFLAKASDRVGPISGEPGSSLPLLLDIDFPGTGVRLSTVDFADAILGNATLRSQVIADAMHQTAVRYGIKTGQRARQSALVDAIDGVDNQIHAMRLRIHESMGEMGMDAGPPPVPGGEVASFADVARHAAEYTSVKGTLPAVIRAQPTEVAGWIENNLSQLASEAVSRRLGPRPRPTEPHLGPLREEFVPGETTSVDRTWAVDADRPWSSKMAWDSMREGRATGPDAALHTLSPRERWETPSSAASQAQVNAWTRAHAKEMVRLRGVSGRIRAMRPLAEEVMDALRFKNADRDRVAASVQHSKQTGARDIRAVDIDAVGRGGSIFVDPRVADTLKMWSRWQKSWNAGSIWRALNNTAKMGLTARSTISAMNNYGSNSLQMMLSHGDITAGNASFYSVARDIWAKGRGELTDMGRSKRLEAYFRTGELNSDIVSVEILDVMGGGGIVKYLEGKGKLSPEGVSLIEGLHKWTGTAKAERGYKGTDNIWKVVEAELNWPIIEGWLDNLGEGKSVELAIGRKETIKFQKVNGKLVDTSGKTISPHRLEDIIARAAIQPGINKFFNMRDTPLLPKYIANEGPGFAVPFMSWAHQALFRAGKGRALPGLMFESLSGHPYIKTNDAGILASLAAKQTATSIRINAMQQAGSGTLYEEGEVLDRKTKRILDHLNAYGGGSRLMLATITATSRLEGKTIEQYNFGGPTIRALNAFEAALSTSAGFYHFAQSVLGAEDLGIYGEFTGDAMNLDQGAGAINEQIGDLRSRASILNESVDEAGVPVMSDRQLGFALVEQADDLKSMREDMMSARKLAVKAMSGATFTAGDLQDMFLVGGSILARSIMDFREGRATWEQSGMNAAKMLLGGNVASFGQAIIDVSEEGSTSAWSTRHSSRKYEGHGESDVEIFINRLTSLGMRTIDPYLMAKGKHSIHETNFKKGFSRDTGRIARAIFDRQQWIANQLKERPVDMGGDVGPPQLAPPDLSSADRGKLYAMDTALSRRLDSMTQFMRTFISQTWDPKDDWSQTPEHLKAARGLATPKALIGRMFDDSYRIAVEAFLEAGIEMTPSGEKAIEKKRKEWFEK
jgi:hypothetical protein